MPRVLVSIPITECRLEVENVTKTASAQHKSLNSRRMDAFTPQVTYKLLLYTQEKAFETSSQAPNQWTFIVIKLDCIIILSLWRIWNMQRSESSLGVFTSWRQAEFFSYSLRDFFAPTNHEIVQRSQRNMRHFGKAPSTYTEFFFFACP